MSIADKLTTIAENEQKIYDAGKKAEYDEFWDDYQNNGDRVDYRYMFAGAGWNDISCKPKYNMYPTQAWSMFNNSAISHFPVGITIDFSNATDMRSVFANSLITELPIIDLSKSPNCSQLFSYANRLRKIEKLILSTTTAQTFTQAFQGLSKLETLIIEGKISSNSFSVQWSPLLTKESLLSILNALKDYSTDTSGTSWVVALGGDNKTKLTEEELKIAENKGWTVN